jgi:hypothetical protein
VKDGYNDYMAEVCTVSLGSIRRVRGRGVVSGEQTSWSTGSGLTLMDFRKLLEVKVLTGLIHGRGME